MKKSQVLLLLALLSAATVSAVPTFAQDSEDEISLDDDLDSEFESTDDPVSFDDFDDGGAENKSQAKQGEPAQEGVENQEDPNAEEMTLEPLKGDEDQVTDFPEDKSKVPPVDEPTPDEMTPPPPKVAEPGLTPEPMAPVDDSPDLEYEARLHDIYRRYYSKKLSEQEWTQLIGERDSEVYKIQAGDTLWGISQTLFNDGNYWPKIWQLNAGISNPHLIQPGNEIRFLLGTESDTPAFAVSEPSAEEPSPEEPIELPVAEEAEPMPVIEGGQEVRSGGDSTPSDEVEIPPPSEMVRPVLKKIPPSLPQWTLQRRGDEYDNMGIDFQRRPILDLQEKRVLEGFLDEENLETDGEVKEIEGGGVTAGLYQYVFIALPSGEGKPGDIYSVVKRAGQLERLSKDVAILQKDLGFQYRMQGEVRLQDLITSLPGEKSRDLFRAIVTRSVGQVELGSEVLRGSLPTVSIAATGERSNVVAQIVGAQVVTQERTVPLYGLAFLAAGHESGLKVNQILTVRANTKVRNPDSIIKESYIPVGLIKVVRVGERFSTAVVIKIWDSIFVGDVTGDGKVLPPIAPENRFSKDTTSPEPEDSALDYDFDETSEAIAPSDGAPAEQPDDFDDLDE